MIEILHIQIDGQELTQPMNRHVTLEKVVVKLTQSLKSINRFSPAHESIKEAIDLVEAMIRDKKNNQ